MTNILQASEENTINTTEVELTNEEMEKAQGGSLFQKCCSGTHLPEVTIELW